MGTDTGMLGGIRRDEGGQVADFFIGRGLD